MEYGSDLTELKTTVNNSVSATMNQKGFLLYTKFIYDAISEPCISQRAVLKQTSLYEDEYLSDISCIIEY